MPEPPNWSDFFTIDQATTDQASFRRIEEAMDWIFNSPKGQEVLENLQDRIDKQIRYDKRNRSFNHIPIKGQQDVIQLDVAPTSEVMVATTKEHGTPEVHLNLELIDATRYLDKTGQWQSNDLRRVLVHEICVHMIDGRDEIQAVNKANTYLNEMAEHYGEDPYPQRLGYNFIKLEDIGAEHMTLFIAERVQQKIHQEIQSGAGAEFDFTITLKNNKGETTDQHIEVTNASVEGDTLYYTFRKDEAMSYTVAYDNSSKKVHIEKHRELNEFTRDVIAKSGGGFTDEEQAVLQETAESLRNAGVIKRPKINSNHVKYDAYPPSRDFLEEKLKISENDVQVL